MKRLATLFGLMFLTAAPSGSAAQTLIKGLRIWTAPDHTRLIFDTEGPIEHQVFSLQHPRRLVIDLQGVRCGTQFPRISDSARFIQRIRSGPRNVNDLRVVLDLKQPIRTKSFLLKPNDLYGYRLVVDLEETPGRPATAPRAMAKARLGPINLPVDVTW